MTVETLVEIAEATLRPIGDDISDLHAVLSHLTYRATAISVDDEEDITTAQTILRNKLDLRKLQTLNFALPRIQSDEDRRKDLSKSGHGK